MKNYGYVRVAAAVPHVQIGDPAANARQIVDVANDTQADVIVFPELCVTGATCGDLFLQQTLLDACGEALGAICAATEAMDGKLVFVGAPVRCDGRLYDCAVAMANGRFLGVVPKTVMSAETGQTRWFTAGNQTQAQSVRLAGQEVPFGRDLLFCDQRSALCTGVEIGEDLWSSVPPSCALSGGGANLIVNPACDSQLVTKTAYRHSLVKVQSARCMTGYVYACAGMDESSSDAVFSGHCMICDNGQMQQESIYRFGVLTALLDLDRIAHERIRMGAYRQQADGMRLRRIGYAGSGRVYLPQSCNPHPFVPQDTAQRAQRCREVIRLQATGLATRLRKTGMQHAVIGISGGLDSTLALIVTAEAFAQCNLDPSGILAITMPGFGTSEQTLQSAKTLIEKFGATMRVIPIEKACMQHFEDIGHDANVRDVTYENTQARERTQILMDVANQMRALVVGTGDLSELALGWCTYNGDHMSMYAVNAGVPKTLMPHILMTYAKTHPECEAVLQQVLDTPISPELLPPDAQGNIAQKTEERIGKYDIHDFILYHALRSGFAPEKIYALLCIAFADVPRATLLETMRMFYRRFFTQQFKRSCQPDGVQIGSVCLSPRGGWNMPSDACMQLWMASLENLET